MSNYKNGDVYFFKVNDKDYNNNSIVVYGEKGKIEITSRPESCKIYKKKKDYLYKNYFLLKKFQTLNLESNEIQKPVLDNIYEAMKKNKKILFSGKEIREYFKIINKINLQ